MFVLNLVIGLSVSPLTAVRKVFVAGADGTDRARLVVELQKLRNVPLFRLDAVAVASALGAPGFVQSVSFKPNLFGRAMVQMQSRAPVATLVGTPACLDGEGSVFVPTKSPGPVPTVVPPKGVHAPNLAVCGAWESSKVAKMCAMLTAQVPNVEWIVEVSDRGVISLQADSGAEVVMGSSESLPQKVQKLRALLAEKPGLLKNVRQLNLTLPSAPMVVRDE